MNAQGIYCGHPKHLLRNVRSICISVLGLSVFEKKIRSTTSAATGCSMLALGHWTVQPIHNSTKLGLGRVAGFCVQVLHTYVQPRADCVINSGCGSVIVFNLCLQDYTNTLHSLCFDKLLLVRFHGSTQVTDTSLISAPCCGHSEMCVLPCVGGAQQLFSIHWTLMHGLDTTATGRIPLGPVAQRQCSCAGLMLLGQHSLWTLSICCTHRYQSSCPQQQPYAINVIESSRSLPRCARLVTVRPYRCVPEHIRNHKQQVAGRAWQTSFHTSCLSPSQQPLQVFIPLTRLCRDSCAYCTFAQPPKPGRRAYMTLDEVLAVCRLGAQQGCKEALFTLGRQLRRTIACIQHYSSACCS